MGSLEYPAEMIFSINAKTFRQSVITIKCNGAIVLRGLFPPRNVTVLIEQEDAESIDISDLQYRAMQRLIDYGMYLTPCMEVYFTECATLWGTRPKNFDGMTFEEAMEAPSHEN